MKAPTHTNRPGTITTADRPGSAAEVDLERIVWDPEYRRAVKPLFDPAKTPKRGESRPRRPWLRRTD